MMSLCKASTPSSSLVDRVDGGHVRENSAVFSPLILASNLVLFFRSEIILDVKRFADLLRRLALDHVGDCFASDVEKSFDIQIVGSKDYLKEHLLIDLHELLIPLIDVCGFLARVGIVFVGLGRIGTVMLAPLDDFLENGFVDVWDGDGLRGSFFTQIANHVLDEDRALCNFFGDVDVGIVGALKNDLTFGRHLEVFGKVDIKVVRWGEFEVDQSNLDW